MIGRDICWKQFGATHILLMAFNGSTGPVMHFHGLTGLEKTICESKLGHNSHMLGSLDSARL